MSGFAPYLANYAPHQAGLVAFAMLAGLPLPWRRTGPPERAAILTLVGLAVLDLLVWLFGSSSALLHLVADGLVFSWMLPVALRANRFYPAIIAAALMVAVLTQLLFLLGLARDASAVALLVNVLHLSAVLAFVAGATVHRRILANGISRPPWRNRLSQG